MLRLICDNSESFLNIHSFHFLLLKCLSKLYKLLVAILSWIIELSSDIFQFLSQKPILVTKALDCSLESCLLGRVSLVLLLNDACLLIVEHFAIGLHGPSLIRDSVQILGHSARLLPQLLCPGLILKRDGCLVLFLPLHRLDHFLQLDFCVFKLATLLIQVL